MCTLLLLAVTQEEEEGEGCVCIKGGGGRACKARGKTQTLAGAALCACLICVCTNKKGQNNHTPVHRAQKKKKLSCSWLLAKNANGHKTFYQNALVPRKLENSYH